MLRVVWLCLLPLGCVSNPADRDLLLFQLQPGAVDRAITALDRAGLLERDDLNVVFSGADQGGSHASGGGPDLLLLEAPPTTLATARALISGLDTEGGPRPVVLQVGHAVPEWFWYGSLPAFDRSRP